MGTTNISPQDFGVSQTIVFVCVRAICLCFNLRLNIDYAQAVGKFDNIIFTLYWHDNREKNSIGDYDKWSLLPNAVQKN